MSESGNGAAKSGKVTVLHFHGIYDLEPPTTSAVIHNYLK